MRSIRDLMERIIVRRQCNRVAQIQNQLCHALIRQDRLQIHLRWAKLRGAIDISDSRIKRQVRWTILPIMNAILRDIRKEAAQR